MADTPSIKIIKQFGYRGSLRNFSNRYHFLGGEPADFSHWTALADAIIAQEKTIYASTVTIVNAIGYNADSDVPIFSAAESTAGTLTPAGSDKEFASDCAALVRFTTDQRTDKNHPIYLFNYYHGAWCDPTSGKDFIASGQRTALLAYAAAWLTGFSDGTNTYTRAGPRGAAALVRTVPAMVTHRDLPR